MDDGSYFEVRTRTVALIPGDPPATLYFWVRRASNHKELSYSAKRDYRSRAIIQESIRSYCRTLPADPIIVWPKDPQKEPESVYLGRYLSPSHKRPVKVYVYQTEDDRLHHYWVKDMKRKPIPFAAFTERWTKVD